MKLNGLTVEEILDESTHDYTILQILNHLRWPESNGTPQRPEGFDGKNFTYRTAQIFAWSKLDDRQILALILMARDEYPLTKVRKLVKIKREYAKKWIDLINEEFAGDIFFPEDDERYFSRNLDADLPKAVLLKVATKSEVAFFIMANKTAKENVFQARFKGYDLGKVRGIYNSLIGKGKKHIELVSQGIDPYEKYTAERSRIESEIAAKEAEDFKKLGDVPYDEWYNQIEPTGTYERLRLEKELKFEKRKLGPNDEDYMEAKNSLIDHDDLNHLITELRSASRNDN